MNKRREAQDLSRYGRNGDSLLMHVHPVEVWLLDRVAKTVGHPGVTTNPITGLPEAFSFYDVLPIVAGAAGTAVGGPMGGMAASALASGASTAAQGGTAQDAITSGLMSGALSGATAGAGSALGGAGGATAQGVTDAMGTGAAGAAPAMGTTSTAGQLAQYGAPTASEAATAGPLAASGDMGQVTALPKEAVTPQLQTAAGATPATPFSGSVDMSGAGMSGGDIAKYGAMGALGVGALADSFGGGGGGGSGWKKASGPYMSQERRKEPEESDSATGEKSYFKPTARTFVSGGGVDMEADHGDGMADKTPAMIDGHQKAALSSGEFVVPADVVSGLGNGSSAAGVKVLREMMNRVRKHRTGGISQAPKINPKKVMPT